MLTEEEKREARATDSRAVAIIGRVEDCRTGARAAADFISGEGWELAGVGHRHPVRVV